MMTLTYGACLDNSLQWSDTDLASPGAIAGGKRASTTDISCMIPTMIFDEGGHGAAARAPPPEPTDGAPRRGPASPPRFLLGTPGSFAIPQTSLQVLVNLLDYKMDVQEAIEAPWALLGEGASAANGGAPQVWVNLSLNAHLC